MPSRPGRTAAGFTLMEMLVTLMLVSFATMLMFQMLGSYRIANDRVREQAGSIDRRALFQAWFRDSVQGLYAAPNLTFVGAPDRFSATTLNPLYAPAGRPQGPDLVDLTAGARTGCRWRAPGRKLLSRRPLY